MATLTYVSQDVVYQFTIQGKEPGIMFNNPAMMSTDTGAMTAVSYTHLTLPTKRIV